MPSIAVSYPLLFLLPLSLLILLLSPFPFAHLTADLIPLRAVLDSLHKIRRGFLTVDRGYLSANVAGLHAAPQLHIAPLPPAVAPAVPDEPVVLIVLGAVAHDGDSQAADDRAARGAATIEDATPVGSESSIGPLVEQKSGQGDTAIRHHAPEHRLRDVEPIGAGGDTGPDVQIAIVDLARPTHSLVGVLGSASQPDWNGVELRPGKVGIDRGAFAGFSPLKVVGTVQELLFPVVAQLAARFLVAGLNGCRCCKGCAGTALSLVLYGVHQAYIEKEQLCQ